MRDLSFRWAPNSDIARFGLALDADANHRLRLGLAWKKHKRGVPANGKQKNLTQSGEGRG
jgi:hypothetical protein